MRHASAHLTKSRFTAGAQCSLRLYNDVYHRDLATPYSDTRQALLDRGTQIGELARDLYPGGVLIARHPWERLAALEDTRRLLEDASVAVIYEAAIEHRGVFVRVDILVRNPDGWDLFEVKGSTKPEKEPFQLDVAIQLWVLEGAGIDVRRAGVLGLDRDYVYPGGEYDLQALFRFADLTDPCREMQGQISLQVAGFHQVLASERPPAIPIGDHCFKPYECPYYAHCTRDLEFTRDPIDDLYRLSATRRAALDDLGVRSIRDIPADFDLTATQQLMRQAVVTGEPWRSPELGRILSEPQEPMHFLDFEAWQPALPAYPGMRPFQSIPFQYSLHLVGADGVLKHLEFLHPDRTDPRRPLAESLLSAIGKTGSIVVYSEYEKRTLEALARDLPDLSKPLLALVARLWDLLPVIQKHFYHPGFRGSFSIKQVLPALVPGEDWLMLEISGGDLAGLAYEQGLYADTPILRDRKFHALKEYCRQDTMAMVQLLGALRNLSNS